MLQKLGRSQYETILTQNEPSFTFDSYQNVTIRVCAFNDDYKLSQICAIPSTVVIDVPGKEENFANFMNTRQRKYSELLKNVYIIRILITSLQFFFYFKLLYCSN